MKHYRLLQNTNGPWPTIDYINQAVADYYKISLKQLLSKQRTRHITHARQTAQWITRQQTDGHEPVYSLLWMAETYDRDHTTIIHAIKTVNQRMTENKFLETEIRQLQQLINDSWQQQTPPTDLAA